jgi:phenylacetate-CoA ligase
MRRKQDARLRDLVTHAYANVALYRRRFDEAGVHPRQIRGVDDLPRLPTLDRSALQSTPLESVLARGADPRKLYKMRTSGSTGMPLTVYVSYRELHWRSWCNRERVRFMTGFKPWHRRADLKIPRARRWWQQPTSRFTDVRIDKRLPPAELLDRIRAFRPRILGGWPSTYLSLCHELEATTGPERLAKAYFQSGETLTPRTAAIMECILGRRPHRTYACWEFGTIATECRPGAGMHIHADNLIVETLPSGSSITEGGDLYITSLRQQAMPLIRYRIGDFGVLSDQTCSCGSPFPILAELIGRSTDSVRTATGKHVSGHEFNFEFRFFEYLDRFQFFQSEPGHLEARILPNARFDAAARQEVLDTLRRVTHDDMRIDLVLTDEFPPPRSGKFKLVVNEARDEFPTSDSPATR